MVVRQEGRVVTPRSGTAGSAGQADLLRDTPPGDALRPLADRMRRARVDESDVLQAAREIKASSIWMRSSSQCSSAPERFPSFRKDKKKANLFV